MKKIHYHRVRDRVITPSVHIITGIVLTTLILIPKEDLYCGIAWVKWWGARIKDKILN